MQAAALTIICLSGMWLIAIGAFMAFRPEDCLRILRLTASSHRINITEQGLRLVAGIAMMVRADAAKFPALFEAGGWFIIVSSLLLMVIPLAWHAGYAIWWAQRLPPFAVRLVAPFSIGAAAALVYLAV